VTSSAGTCRYCQGQIDETAEVCSRCGRSPLVLAEGDVLAGRYEILRSLGKGGMGIVYAARDRELDEKVAIKILRPEASASVDLVRRFRSEIRLARKVRHRNVCAIHEFGVEDRLQFIVMELIEGIDVRQLLRQRGRLRPVEAFDIVIQVARGLVAIHEVGILHRDLKTPNIMRDAAGVTRLMDFGIAKSVDSGTQTATGMIVGTPDYMSPEQIEGKRPGPPADIYSLGVVVFEVFMGRLPFAGENALSTMWQHQNNEPPIAEAVADGLPPPLAPVIAKALAKRPEDRFATAQELVDALVAARTLALPENPTTPAPWQSLTVSLPETGEAPATGVSTAARGTFASEPSPAVPASESRGAQPVRPAGRPPYVALGLAAVGVLAAGALVFGRRAEPPRTEVQATGLPSPSPTLAPTPTAAAPASPSPSPEPVLATPSAPARPSPTASARAARPSQAPAAIGLVSQPKTAALTPPTPAPVGVTSTTPEPARPEANDDDAVGQLRVRVVPWAEVEVDGTRIGTTPFKPLLLPPGVHVIGLRHPGYKPLVREVTIKAGEQTRLDVDLSREGTAENR